MDRMITGCLMCWSLVVVVFVSLSPSSVNSLPPPVAKSLVADRCRRCLPAQLVGSLRVTSGPPRGARHQEEDDGGLRLAFDVDLDKGMIILEQIADDVERNVGGRHQDDGSFPLWTVVIDTNHRSHVDLNTSPSLAFFAVRHDSNNVWLLDLLADSDRRRRPQRHRYVANSCLHDVAELQHYDEDRRSYVYSISTHNEQSLVSPLQLTLSSDECLPSEVSTQDPLIKLTFDEISERSRDYYTLRDLLTYRLLASSSSINCGHKTPIGLDELALRNILHQTTGHQEGMSPDLPDQMVKAAKVLASLLFRQIRPDPPRPTCQQLQWQATVSNAISYRYKVGLQKSGTQSTYMPRLYVDGVGQRVCGGMSDVVNGQLADNITFLVTYSSDRSDALIYIVSSTTNTCFASNVTGIPPPPSATFVRTVTVGVSDQLPQQQMTLDVYSTVYNQSSFNGTVDYYVDSTADVDPDAFGRMSCATVARTYSWSSQYEEVNGMSVITNSTFGISDPDTVFAVPAACSGVPIQSLPVGQARDVYNSVLSYVVSVI